MEVPPDGTHGRPLLRLLGFVGLEGILRIEFGQRRHHEERGDEEDKNGQGKVGNVECLVGRLRTPIGVEEHATDYRTKGPTEAVERLGKIDAGGGIALVAEDRGIGIGDRLKECQSHGNQTDTQQKSPELLDMGRGDKPEAADRDQQKSDDDPPAITELLGHPPSGERDQKISEVVGELNPGRLRTVQMKQVLEVLVHGIDHGVAERPEEKERGDQDERQEIAFTIRRTKHREEPCHGGLREGSMCNTFGNSSAIKHRSHSHHHVHRRPSILKRNLHDA